MKMALLSAAHHSPEQIQSIAGGGKGVWTSDGVKAMMNAGVVYLGFLQKNLQQGKKRQAELPERLKREKDVCK